MLTLLTRFTQPLFNLPLIRRTRRNHGLEHATVHLLADRYKGQPLLGHSTDQGFVLFANLPATAVQKAAEDALNRMKRGEHHLAIHPGCGTSRLTAGLLTSLTAIVMIGGTSRRDALINRLPNLLLVMILAMIAAEPLGLLLQKHITTDGNPADMEILKITSQPSRMPLTWQPTTLYTIRTRSR